MKIVWATPYCKQSAIGRYSEAVINELRSRGHHVAIYRTEVGEDLAVPPRADVGVLEPGSRAEMDWLLQADLIIANVGDYFAYHGRLFELATIRPYVAVLHDWCVLGLFLGWLQSIGRVQDASRIVTQMYGGEAGHQCASANAENFYERATRLFPLTEWVAGNTLGCIIHSNFYGARVRASSPGPVHKLSLAYPVEQVQPSVGVGVSGSERLAIRTFGVVNPNKRVEWVIRAVAADPELARHVDYRVLGPCSDDERARLHGICEEVGFQGLTLEGRVSHERLLEGLAEADVICCLRDPAVEGASASAIEGMQSGAPVIVSNAGFYAELPDDLVLKVPAGDSRRELLEHLQFVWSNRPLARELAERAGAWAAEEFSARRYVDGLERIIPEYIAAEPYIRTARMYGGQLGRMRLSGSSSAAQRVSRTLESMFSL
ncbi:glycosyltransferase family 4 protein [Xanthomonas maliensis]|uniref:glycosyltransferase family 4 protein n=1 Tax=Xanthomonas maliensis TaxID=1321368 RepID=UPI00126589FE|nr:glycosyltransferase family 4 protein [Xanthomonas maliensis]KAB7765821.1 glyscosyl transferase [Xanthomonas maliensis]